MLPSETMIWQPEFTDKTLSRKPGAVHMATYWLLKGEKQAGQSCSSTT
ncbi:PapI protein [Escherichia coli O10:K5(L):H4 str. ATCC 23506]|nr:PapI protein [Escherichia coli O10:K5(L):H4 str. ATCC 23506]